MTVKKKPGVFEDVTLTWEGNEFIIESDRVMGAIARIEQHITIPDLMRATETGQAKLAVLSCAFGSVLRYAGATVKDEEVYNEIFTGDNLEVVKLAIQALLDIMLPPSMRKTMVEKVESEIEEIDPKNGNRQTRRAAASLSRKRTKRRVSGASPRNSSGVSTPPSSGGKQSSGESVKPTVQ